MEQAFGHLPAMRRLWHRGRDFDFLVAYAKRSLSKIRLLATHSADNPTYSQTTRVLGETL